MNPWNGGTARLFVYGTLKAGFPNHHVNGGRRIDGSFVTRQAFPLLVVRLPHEDRAPWLLDQPGQGMRVVGEVYEVPADSMPRIDALEEVGQPHGYRRQEIEVEARHAPGTYLRAYAYLKPAEQLGRCLAREGPFDEYTLPLARGYWLEVP